MHIGKSIIARGVPSSSLRLLTAWCQVAMAIRSFPELKFEEPFPEGFLQGDRSGMSFKLARGKDDRDVEFVRIRKRWSGLPNDAE